MALLHAVRSAITATAELIAITLSIGPILLANFHIFGTVAHARYRKFATGGYGQGKGTV